MGGTFTLIACRIAMGLGEVWPLNQHSLHTSSVALHKVFAWTTSTRISSAANVCSTHAHSYTNFCSRFSFQVVQNLRP